MSLFNLGSFELSSGERSDWIIDCRSLTDDDWAWAARYVAQRSCFSSVEGVPTGGLAFAEALRPYCEHPSLPTLLVDDVMTTGASLVKLRGGRDNVVGWVMFDRSGVGSPSWVSAIWSLCD